MSNVYQKLIWF